MQAGFVNPEAQARRVIPAFYPIPMFLILIVGDADKPWLMFLAKAVTIQSR